MKTLVSIELGAEDCGNDLEILLKRNDLVACLSDIRQYVRALDKYGEERSIEVGKLREEIHRIISNYNLGELV